MITKTFVPKNKTNDPYFNYEIPFDGDTKKTYTCEVLNSNLPTPKVIGFNTKTINGLNQNFIILEFSARCNNTQITLGFLTETEVIEVKKREYFTWISKYFTVFDFVFRIFKLDTLKGVTKSLIIAILVLVTASTILTGVDYAYERATGESILESEWMQWWSEMTMVGISRRAKEDGPELIEDFTGFMKDKAESAKETMQDAFETTKEKAEDLKEDIGDKIEDMKD